MKQSLPYLGAALVFVGGAVLLRYWDIPLLRDRAFTISATVLAAGLLSLLAYKQSEDWRPALAIVLGFLLVLIPSTASRVFGPWITTGVLLIGAILIMAGMAWGSYKGIKSH